MSTATCPDAMLLRRLLDEPDADEPAVTAHLDSCAVCQLALEELAAGRDSWAGARVELEESERQEPPEAALARAVAALEDEAGLGPRDAAVEPLSFLTPPRQPGHLGRLGHYDVLEVLGSGGMGIVLKAFDEKLHRVVAIKVIAPELAASGSARKRFSREARAAAAVAHEHVVTIHAVEDEQRPPYLVMEYVAGPSLQQRLDDGGPLELRELLRVGYQTAAGLAAAHAQGLVHRDVKPGNILLQNGLQRVKLTDFGLARAADDASVTQSGVIVGTPMYMAPEQARGEPIDHRADLFSLGSVLYAMCTGRAPYRAGTLHAVLRRVADEAPPPVRTLNPDVPDWLEAIIGKLHARRPEHRFQSAAEVAEALRQHLAHLQQPHVHPPPAPEPSAVEEAARPRLRVPRSLPIAAGFLTVASVLLLGLLYLMVRSLEAALPFQAIAAGGCAVLILALWRIAGLSGVGYFLALLVLGLGLTVGVPYVAGLDGSASVRLVIAAVILMLALAIGSAAWHTRRARHKQRIALAAVAGLLALYALALLTAPLLQRLHGEGILLVHGPAAAMVRIDENGRTVRTMHPGVAMLRPGEYQVYVWSPQGRLVVDSQVTIRGGTQTVLHAPAMPLSPDDQPLDAGAAMGGEGGMPGAGPLPPGDGAAGKEGHMPGARPPGRD